MQNIAFYLQKYAKIGFKEEGVKKCLITAIKEVCNVDLDPIKIKITQETIHIHAVGIEKSEIFVNTKKIVDLFNQKMEYLGYKILDKKII